MFTPRRIAPTKLDKRFITIESGGWNECILGNPPYSRGSVLANCVGYCWGRWLELLGLTTNYNELKLPTITAKYWFGYNDGYSRGQTAKLGAIACWGHPTKSGHLAVVEEILPNGDIVCSNSDYGKEPYEPYGEDYPYFYMWTYRKTQNYINGLGEGYYLQGYIYLPVEPIVVKRPKGKFPFVLYARRLRGEE